MSHNCVTPASAAQASALVAHSLARHLTAFLAPVLRTLDQRLDRRLVSTFLATLIAIVQWRNRAHGLLLSELGAYLLMPAQAPARTTRPPQQSLALRALDSQLACRLVLAAG